MTQIMLQRASPVAISASDSYQLKVGACHVDDGYGDYIGLSLVTVCFSALRHLVGQPRQRCLVSGLALPNECSYAGSFHLKILILVHIGREVP